MKSFATLFALTSLLFVSVGSAPVSIKRRDVNPALVPEFGHPQGLNPTGTGDCDGITNAAGVVVKIPCACPPNRADFLAVRRTNYPPHLILILPLYLVSQRERKRRSRC